MSNNYTILHCHTMLSNGITNIDSVTKYSDYIKRAVECNMKALALSEHGSVLEWYHKKTEMEKNGLKYIHAEEFYVTETLKEKIRDNYHCLLIAKNYDGFLELNKLSSKSFNREDNSFYYVPRISYDDLKNTSDNIIICTACLAGILSKGNVDLKNDFFNFILEHKDRCFLELQPHLDPQQIEYNKLLYNLSNEYGIDCVMCTDTHALNKEHIKGREILQKAKNIHFENEDNFHLEFLTYDELVNLCKQQNAIPLDGYLKAIEQTNTIADMIETWEIDYSYKYPHLWGENSEQVLREKIKEGIVARGVDKYPNYQEYLDRIEYEMKAYVHNQAVDFMLLMADICVWCKEQDIGIGYGRGSANGSVIAWLLFITEMDSIKHKLNFDRFMNVERVSLSDIDTDFPPSRINEVKQYIFNKHGLYCSDIVTFNTIALKGAIRDVGRALEMPLDLIGDICDNIEFKEDYYRKEFPKLFEYVDLVNGVIVSVGNHPCFTADTLITTKEGLKNINDVEVGDEVLTIDNDFHKVVNTMTHISNDIGKIRISGSVPFDVTPNHPFYKAVKRTKKKKELKDYKWETACNLKKGDFIGVAINNKSILPKLNFTDETNYNFWWCLGRYFGDGWRSHTIRKSGKRIGALVKDVIICCNKNNNETEEIIKHLDWCNYRIAREKTTNKIYLTHIKGLYDWLDQFGDYAIGKHFTNTIFDLPIDYLKVFLDGYLSADGCCSKDFYSIKTISKQLAYGVVNCVHKIYHTPCNMCLSKTSGKEIIEGRIVNCHPRYVVNFKKDISKNNSSFYYNNYMWYPFKEYIPSLKSDVVYNFEVEDNHTYIANNYIVHNCGLIVSPHSISDKLGLFSTATDTVMISQINMKEVDAQNYVKLDLLKLDTIELINETCKLANIKRILPDDIDINDINVWNSMRDDTTQIFQWEGKTGNDYIKQLLSDENIKKFQEIDENVDRMTLLSIGNSAIRPAGASYRNDLANGVVRKSGSKAIDDFLKPTFGYLVFQCQIIEFLHSYCGFTMGEADVVRRHFAKKYGTDKDIPIIKNGGYINDKKDHYIDGFIATMKKKYNMSEEEAENTITSFLQVIEDASRYLFSLNHSCPYSYEGYVSGWLRYYYPLEFLTVALNINKDNEEKTKGLTNYAQKNDIKIKSPKFRYSKSEYFCDKENNCIYKGIGSIKFMNNQIADELFALRDNSYESFLELLYDINNNTSINSRQLTILIKINYFIEFGNINTLLKQVDIYNNFISCKNLKKDKCEKLGIDFDIVRECCEKETEKTFNKIDNIKLIRILCDLYENTDDLEIVSYQLKYLGYTDINYVNNNNGIYVVSNIETNKYGTTFMSLYGGITHKIKRSSFAEHPCDTGDIVKCIIREQYKKIQDENGKWVNSDELETIIKDYTIIKKCE